MTRHDARYFAFQLIHCRRTEAGIHSGQSFDSRRARRFDGAHLVERDRERAALTGLPDCNPGFQNAF